MTIDTDAKTIKDYRCSLKSESQVSGVAKKKHKPILQNIFNQNIQCSGLPIESPRSHLQNRRTSSPAIIGVNGSSQIPVFTNNSIFQFNSSSNELSLEHISKELLDKTNYYDLTLVKLSKEKSFNATILSSIKNTIACESLQCVNIEKIDATILNIINAEVNNHINEAINYSTFSHGEFHSLALEITHILFDHLRNSDILYQEIPISYNLLFIKFALGKALAQNHSNFRSAWTDLLVETLEKGMSVKKTRGFNFYQKESITNNFTLLIDIIFNQTEDSDIESILLQAVNSDESTAKDALNRCSYWMSTSAFPEMLKFVKNKINTYFDLHLIQTKTFTFPHETLTLRVKEAKADIEQIARSYILSKRLNYDILQVNDEDVSDKDLKGSVMECQKTLFNRFLSKIYTKGFSNNTEMTNVELEVENLLNRKKFLGKEILFFGSVSAWAICDTKIRKLYPLLFTSPYSTRVQQGTKCYIQIESKKKYSVLLEKNYYTYQLLYPENKESFAINKDIPLVSTQVSWQIDFHPNNYFIHSISTPVIKRLNASEIEWSTITNLLATPFPIKDDSIL